MVDAGRGGEGGSGGSGGSGASGGKSDAGSDDEVPVYVTAVTTWDVDGKATLYARLSTELTFDLSADDLNDESVRTFAGYTGLGAIDGYVITGDSETPFATKFEITDDLAWKQVGNKLSFTDYVTDDGKRAELLRSGDQRRGHVFLLRRRSHQPSALEHKRVEAER